MFFSSNHRGGYLRRLRGGVIYPEYAVWEWEVIMSFIQNMLSGNERLLCYLSSVRDRICQQSWQGRLMKIRQNALREIARVTLQSVLRHVCIRHTTWVKSLHKACSSTCVQDQARHTAWVKMVNSCYCFEDAKKKSMGNDYVHLGLSVTAVGHAATEGKYYPIIYFGLSSSRGRDLRQLRWGVIGDILRAGQNYWLIRIWNVGILEM